MSRRTAFEERIRESLESYEAPYDPSPWEGIEKELDRMEGQGSGEASKSGKGNRVKWGIGAAATLVAASLILMNIEEKDEKEQGSEPEETVRTEVNEEVGPEEKENEAQKSTDSENEGEQASPKPDPELKEEQVNVQEKEENQEVAQEASPEAEAGSGDPDETPTPPEEEKEKVASQGGNESPSKLPTEVRIEADNNEGCAPTMVSFRSDVDSDELDHFWEFGDGDYSNQPDPEHRYEEAGVYSVKLTLTDAESGKTVREVEEDLVRIHASPEAKITENGKGEGVRPAVRFELEDKRNIENLVWELGDGTRIEDRYRVEHRYASKGVYPVSVQLESEEGCRNGVSYRYEQKHSFNLLAPNAFSPDGDGRNDRFIPKALHELDLPFTMTIHDRQGRVVHKADRADEAWDGRIRNSGKRARPGDVFIWVVVLENGKGEEETYKGTVTVTP